MKKSLSSVSASILVDTNLLLYTVENDEPAKQATARRLLSDLIDSERLVLSAQVLNEFYSRSTGKRRAQDRPFLTPSDAATLISYWIDTAPIIPLDQQTTLLAIRATIEHQLHFWDALIWAAAKLHGITSIYTEDGTHNQEIEGVRRINPFLIESPA